MERRVLLITGKSVPLPNAAQSVGEGDEIVRTRLKNRDNVNPLVPGSSPGGPTNFSMQQPFWGLFLVYPSEEAAWALGFRVGLEETTSAVNAERYEANDECHQSGGLPRRENHRGGEGIAICCTSEARQ